jgi:hypothetical protein
MFHHGREFQRFQAIFHGFRPLIHNLWIIKSDCIPLHL